VRISLLKFNNLKKKKKKICKDLYITFKSGKITQNLNKKGENIKYDISKCWHRLKTPKLECIYSL
jgi:hypothetical protein